MGPRSTVTRTRYSDTPSRRAQPTPSIAAPKSSLSMSSSTAGSGSRPRGPDDLIELSPERKTAILQLMEESERGVVASMIGEHASLTSWKPRVRKKGIAYYVDENVGKGLTRFCCVGHTDAPVAEIMKMFMVSNTDTLLKNVRIMYRNVTEARILSVLQPATRVNPMHSVYIRYLSFDTPKLMSGRDLCVCVSTNLLTLSDNSTVGYCLWDSVELPECPDRYATDKIIRSKMWRSGYFFRNSGKPYALTKVCYLIGVEIGGPAPQLTGRIYMSIFGGNCSRVCKHYRKRSLDPETFVSRSLWKPKNTVKACSVCTRAFTALHKRYHCVCCGDVVCRRCFFTEDVSVRGAVVTRVRICSYCMHRAGMLRSNIKALEERDSLGSVDSDGTGVRDLLRRDSTPDFAPLF
ncbi:hypothetical protein BBJ28_00013281 [Nothophytophthora sp. Chile5]|nr:hypothetical protein BBJ28_00013281 [Nothophytophthora sp. Chile5]